MDGSGGRPARKALGRSGGGRHGASYMCGVSPLHASVTPFLFALASLRAVSARAQPTPEADTTATIRGLVYDSLLTGGPVAGAQGGLGGTKPTAPHADPRPLELAG